MTKKKTPPEPEPEPAPIPEVSVRPATLMRRLLPAFVFVGILLVMVVIFYDSSPQKNITPSSKTSQVSSAVSTKARYDLAKIKFAKLQKDADTSAQEFLNMSKEFYAIYSEDKKWPNRPAALMRSARALELAGNKEFSQPVYNLAVERYKRVSTEFWQSVLADDALLQAAIILSEKLNKSPEALYLLSTVRNLYPKGDMILKVKQLEKKLQKKSTPQIQSTNSTDKNPVLQQFGAIEAKPINIHKEAILKEANRQEAILQAQAEQEAARLDSIFKEYEKNNFNRLNAVNNSNLNKINLRKKKAARLAILRQNVLRAEALRQEQAKKETLRLASIAKEYEDNKKLRLNNIENNSLNKVALRKKKAAKLSTLRQEILHQEALRLEALRQEQARQETLRLAKILQKHEDGKTKRLKNLESTKLNSNLRRKKNAAKLATLQQEKIRQEALRQEQAIQEALRLANIVKEHESNKDKRLANVANKHLNMLILRKKNAASLATLHAIKLHKTALVLERINLARAKVAEFSNKNSKTPIHPEPAKQVSALENGVQHVTALPKVLDSTITNENNNKNQFFAELPPELPPQSKNSKLLISLPPEMALTPKAAQPPSKDIKNTNPDAGPKSVAAQLGLSVQTVFIDIGHGGKDPGASHNDIIEKDTVLLIGKQLGEILKQKGFNVIFSREDDTFIPLSERSGHANSENADIFVSIHINASHSKSVQGFETYYLDFAKNSHATRVATLENANSDHQLGDMQDLLTKMVQNVRTDESINLATSIQKSTLDLAKQQGFPTEDGGIRSAPFHVLIGTNMPAILVEVGYCSHKREAKLLKSAAYRLMLVQGIALGIENYKKLIENSN